MSRMMAPAFFDIDTEEERIRRTKGTLACIFDRYTDITGTRVPVYRTRRATHWGHREWWIGDQLWHLPHRGTLSTEGIGRQSTTRSCNCSGCVPVDTLLASHPHTQMWSLFSRDPSKDFPYEVAEVLFQHEASFWIMHRGKRKVSFPQLSIFDFNSGLLLHSIIRLPVKLSLSFGMKLSQTKSHTWSWLKMR